MPDATAETMTDAQVRPGPALSATSDAPVIDTASNSADEAQAAADEAARVAAEEGAAAKEASEGGEGKEPKAREDKRVPVGEVTKARAREREARDVADRLAKQNEELSKAVERLTTKEVPADKPNRDAFDDPAVYDAALDAWNDARIEQAAKEAVETHQQKTQRDAAEQQRQRMADAYRDDVEVFKQDHPDFDDVFTDDVTVSQTMALAIAESDAKAAISYWLGQNKDEATRIAGLSPVAQIKEIARIEAKLDATPALATTAKPKPAPIRPVGQRSGTSAKDPAEMSTDEYALYRNAQLREQRAH